MKFFSIAIVILLWTQMGFAQTVQRVPLPWLPQADTTHAKQIRIRTIDCNEVQTGSNITTFDEHGYPTHPYSPRSYDRQGRLTSFIDVTKESNGLKTWLDTTYSLQITYHPQYNLPQECTLRYLYKADQTTTVVYKFDNCKIDKQGRTIFYRYLVYHDDRIDSAVYHCFFNQRGQIVEECFFDPFDTQSEFKKLRYYNNKGKLQHASNYFYEYYDTLDYHYDNGILVGWSGRGYSQGDECQITVTCTPMGTPTGKEERWFEYEWHPDGTRSIYRDNLHNYDFDSYGNIIRDVTPCGGGTLWEIEYYR